MTIANRELELYKFHSADREGFAERDLRPPSRDERNGQGEEHEVFEADMRGAQQRQRHAYRNGSDRPTAKQVSAQD